MAHPILATKLFIPPPRPNLVSRPRLIERLNEGLNCKLILICAPAGFGKSTLLIDWVHRSRLPVAWISLDSGDNDWNGFLAYCVAALQTIAPGLGETVPAMIQSPQPPPVENVLTALINDIAALRQEFILVLDDYHVIEAGEIHDILTFLLDHLPHQMHLAIASRSDPFLPLSRLRSKGQLIELRAENLRFKSKEAAIFFSQVMGLTLSEEEMAALESRTEGWIAGLQLAGLSILDRMQSGGDPNEFITDFSGDDRFIVDYLVDEVLAQLPQETRDFLLQTSILDRLSGSLCEAVTGKGGGQKILELLERTNLFILPLDNRRRWYRYHHLFADLLEQRLKETAPLQEIASLHQRASRWYEENNFFAEAVEHALAAREYKNVIRLIYRDIVGIFQRSDLNRLLKWQAALPPDFIAAEPKLGFALAWAWIATGHPEEAETRLQIIEAALGARMDELFQQAEDLDPKVRNGLAETAVLRAQLAIGRGDLLDAQRLASQVQPYLVENEDSFIYNSPADLRTIIFFIQGLVEKLTGNLQRAGETLSRAAALGQSQGNVHIFEAASGHLANVQAMQGNLREAVTTCRRGLNILEEMAWRNSPLISQLHVELGSLSYERDDLETARQHILEGIALAKTWGYWESLVPGYLGLARISAAQNDWEGAWSAFGDLETLGRDYPHLAPTVASSRALLFIIQGRTEEAMGWAQSIELAAESRIDLTLEGKALILVRWFIAQSRWVEAVELIDRLLDAAHGGGRFSRVIELLALKSIVYHGFDDLENALDLLSQALKLAEPEGFVRTFVDLGEPMSRLLYQAVERGVAPGYAGALLAAFPEVGSPVEVPVRHPAPGRQQEIVEPLSEREVEILTLIAQGLTNKQIANQLYLSLGTIKVHAHNIYGKLGVSSRTQAVAIATELGILPNG